MMDGRRGTACAKLTRLQDFDLGVGVVLPCRSSDKPTCPKIEQSRRIDVIFKGGILFFFR